MTQSADVGSSVVRRWQLAASLKQLRERADLTQDQAVEVLQQKAKRWSKSKLSRIENREHNTKPVEAEQLLDAYGVTDLATREALVQLAAEAHVPGWWLSFASDLPEDVQPLLSIEGGLVAFRDFQNMLLHGLVQTADYARAVINAINPAIFSPEQVERGVAARMVRQQILDKPNPASFHFILDEGILDRIIGRPSIMRDQLRKLLDLTERGNVTIQVLSRKAGGSPGLEGPFSILTLPEPIPDILYTEGAGGMLYVENREAVRPLVLRFGILTQRALSRADSIDLIARLARDYE